MDAKESASQSHATRTGLGRSIVRGGCRHTENKLHTLIVDVQKENTLQPKGVPAWGVGANGKNLRRHSERM